MVKTIIILFFFLSFAASQTSFKTDTLETTGGPLEITFIAHGTLMMKYNGIVLHIDPVSRYADYTKLPDADIILITHHHGDHMDPAAINELSQKDTKLIYTAICSQKKTGGMILPNGKETTIDNIEIKSVPAYNLVHKRDDGSFFHVKGECNGYILSFSGYKVYVAGDTEDIPEMKNWKGVDVAFLPMNLPYTMTPGMVAHAVDMLQPKIFYPYHFGDTNMDDLLVLLKNKKDVDVRVRNMK
ncbi:MAG: MBL fold metallo-hydrolase [Calditrichae bacterium]|nr:MBL fold metallo-hydrolase [Calditrichia bacterium]